MGLSLRIPSRIQAAMPEASAFRLGSLEKSSLESRFPMWGVMDTCEGCSYDDP